MDQRHNGPLTIRENHIGIGLFVVETSEQRWDVFDGDVNWRKVKVKKGQTIVLDPDDGLLAVDNDAEKAVLAAFAKLDAGMSCVTIYYGEEATLDAAERLAQRVTELAPGLEAVDVLHGGQPHYRYLISAE